MTEDIIVELKVKNPKVTEELTKVIASIEGFRLDKRFPDKPCDLLILEIGDDLKEEFKLIHTMQSSKKVGSIYLTSSRLEPEVLIEALRAGAREFFSQPIKVEEVRRALLKFKETRTKHTDVKAKKRKGKLIHIIGSKGGVGVTTIAVNLAAGLVGHDRSVALVDMNLTFSELPIFLDVKESFDWAEIGKNISRVDSTLLKSSLYKHPSGIFLLTSPTGLDGVNQTTPDTIGKLMEVMQSTFEYTIIDGGPLLEDLSLKTMEIADTVIVVGVLNLLSLNNIKRLLWTFQNLGYPKKETIKIILNRYEKDPVLTVKESEQSIDHSFSWLIPNDFKTTMTAINLGKIILEVGKNTDISKSFRDLAASILGGSVPEKEKTGFWNKFKKTGL